MAEVEGQPGTEPTALEQGQPGSEPAGLESMQEFVSPEATQTEAQPQQTDEGTDSAKYFQSKASKAEAARLAAEQRAQILQEQLLAVTQHQQQNQAAVGNPYDFGTQTAQWLEWKIDNAVSKTAEASARQSREELNSLLQRAYEDKWQAEHQDVDISAVKAFQQTNGIKDIDHAYKILTYDDRLQGAVTQGKVNAITQFRNPSQGAQPLRNTGPGTPGTVGLKFMPMLDAYTKNPSVADTWHPGAREAFFKHLEAAKRELG